MSEEIRQKMAAYRKAKEDALRREDSEIEAIRWHLTNAIIEKYPMAEIRWITYEGLTPLRVEVRLDDYVWGYQFGHDFLDAPGFAMSLAITELLQRMELDPLRQIFAD